MSALGQKQTFALQQVMSALPPKADIGAAQNQCPLCANSGHSAIHSITSQRDEYSAEFAKQSRFY
jgi:hypothetical protein